VKSVQSLTGFTDPYHITNARATEPALKPADLGDWSSKLIHGVQTEAPAGFGRDGGGVLNRHRHPTPADRIAGDPRSTRGKVKRLL
jgi:hypothetical protein